MADRRSRRDIAVAGLAGAAFAVLVIVASSGGDVDAMTFGDGRLHRAVAQDLDADDPELQRVISGSGPALRYGRIALPATLWTLSGGNHDLMRFMQPAIMVLCAAGIAMTTRALFPSAPLAAAMAPFLAIGMTMSIAGGFSEPMSIALALLAFWLLRDGRLWPAAAAFAGAMLARENAAAVLLGVAVWELFHGRRRGAAILMSSAIPVAGWHLVVAERFGYLPLRDPWLVDTGALGAPVVNLVRSLGEVGAGGILLIAVHVALAIVAFGLWRSSMFGAAAAMSALPILSVGPFSWRYLGDAARLAAFLEVLVVLALVHLWAERRTADRGGPYPVELTTGHALSR